jgi:hypothetical protein
MEKIIIISLLVISILQFSCSEDIPTTSGNIKKYPDSLGTEWEYHTTIYTVFYDTSGSITGTYTLDIGNTIAKVEKTNDTLGSYTDLTLFTSSDVATPQNIGKYWYRNIDTGLYSVAYTGAGSSQPILPKSKPADFIESLIKQIKISFTPLNPGIQYDIRSDSLYFNDPPRKVFKYPLIVGNNWVEMTTPFHREKFINQQENITTPIGTYKTYVVESKMKDFSNISYIDYINLDIGLLLREVAIDSTILLGQNLDTLGYYDFKSISELVRKD